MMEYFLLINVCYYNYNINIMKLIKLILKYNYFKIANKLTNHKFILNQYLKLVTKTFYLII